MTANALPDGGQGQGASAPWPLSEETEAALVFLGFVLLGLAAMAPSVTFGDAGEFAACAATLSLAHAPSYPLLAVLGKALGKALPWGNWAYRTNLLSALCGAGALALLVWALRLAGIGLAGRLGAALILGLCPLWRYESGVTEVFALHGLVLAFVLWLLCRFSQRLCAPRPMLALGLAFGLGMANHHTLALVAPAAAWEVWRSWRLSQGRSGGLARAALCAVAGFVLGFALYAFLPLRARASPPFDWGHPVDLARFLWVFLRKDYGSLSLTVQGSAPFSAATVWTQSWRYLRGTFDGFGALGVALAAMGLFCRDCRGLSRVGLVLWVLLSGPFLLILGNPPFDSQTSGALERFNLASWLGLACLAAAGIESISRRWRIAAFGLVLAALAAAWPGRSQWWLRSDLAAYDYGRSVLKSLPQGSSLFMDGGDDTFYTTAFLSFAQRLRPDVDLHDRGGVVFHGAYGPDFRRLPGEDKEARRVEVERPLAAAGGLFYSTLKDEIIPGMGLQPWGLLRRPVPAGRPALPMGLWDIYPFRWSETLLAEHYRDRALVCFYPFMKAVALRSGGRPAQALQELREALSLGPDVQWLGPQISLAGRWLGFAATQSKDLGLAEQAFKLALAAEPDLAETYDDLGTVYERSGRGEEAERAYQKAARLDPKSGKAYYNLGAFYWARSRWAESAAAFAQAARLEPADAAALRYAAQARSRTAVSR
jgi:tetratricopeptide (TPR) repeat protein